MRVAIHDYSGHPFQLELSRELAHRGYVVQHFFFAGDPGPKASVVTKPDDSCNLSIRPVTLRSPYLRESLPRRYIGDVLYGKAIYKHVKAFRPDVIISGNAPLHAHASLQRVASQCHAKFVYWVQDLHGVAMKRLLTGRWLGMGGLVADYYMSWEHSLLRQSNAIAIISPDFRKWLPSDLRREDKTKLIMNWGPLSAIQPSSKANPWSEDIGVSERFVFAYTGTLGRKHDPRLLWALSEAFKDDENVVIVVAASGASADVLRALQSASPRSNLRLMPPQPMEVLPDLLGSSDVLVALLEVDAGEFSVPSKVLTYLCAGRPILLSAPLSNLASRILKESGGGVVVDARCKQAFIDAALKLRQDHSSRCALGRSARKYATSHFHIAEIASQFESLF
jgi:colanic acid biosynthesis glycosyl transferase WcaI